MLKAQGQADGEALFLRISGPMESRITHFSPEGILAWTSEGTGDLYTVEIATHIGEPGQDWTPFTSVKVSSPKTEISLWKPNSQDGMVFVPEGTFTMGDPTGDGHWAERPAHQVTLSHFWMAQNETTNEEMVGFLNWANDQDRLSIEDIDVYSTVGERQVLINMHTWYGRIEYDGSAFVIREPNGAGHPAVNVTWYGAASFCNWKSEQTGLQPCYNLQDWSCAWEATGYRLPTEA